MRSTILISVALSAATLAAALPVSEEALAARGGVFSKPKKDNPPSYKKVSKDPVPKYHPGGHPQHDFHSTHDPAAGSNRKDGSSRPHRREITVDDIYELVARGGVFSKPKKDDPPSYKKVSKDPVPKYHPGGHPQHDFHSTHDPAAGSNRKDGSSRPHRREFDDEEDLMARGGMMSKISGKKEDKPPSYKKVSKDPVPKYHPGGHPQHDFHSTHDPAAGSNRKDGSSRPHRREFDDDEELSARGGMMSKISGKKEDKPPSYKKVSKDPVPKYNPGGHPQLEFHSTHDPAAGSHRKDGSRRP